MKVSLISANLNYKTCFIVDIFQDRVHVPFTIQIYKNSIKIYLFIFKQVGNDGNVYVGRGWNYANTYSNKSLAVTLIGDFVRYAPSETQFEAIQHLLSYGVAKNYLAADYKLVAQNQTKKTRSPGPSVYKEITKWPRWSRCGIDDNPPCGIEIGLPTVWDAKQ